MGVIPALRGYFLFLFKESVPTPKRKIIPPPKIMEAAVAPLPDLGSSGMGVLTGGRVACGAGVLVAGGIVAAQVGPNSPAEAETPFAQSVCADTGIAEITKNRRLVIIMSSILIMLLIYHIPAT